MRVLHLLPGNLYGGVETFIACMARRKDLASDLEHHFALCFEGRLAEELATSHAPVHRLGAMRARFPWTVVRGRHRLTSLLGRSSVDVAVTHSSWSHAMFAPVLHRQGVPNVFYLHGPIGDMGWTDRLAARTLPAAMIAVSRDTLGTGQKLFPDVAAHVLNYPIPWPAVEQPLGVRDEVRADLGAGPGEVVLLQASRADSWKGHDRLLAALARLLDVPGWTCWIAGGAQRPKERRFLAKIREQASRLGLERRVRFLGERRDVPRLLAAADVYCQANVGGEGFSLAFMEAFNAGLPIVTTDIGGAPELIDDSCGVLVGLADTAAFAAALRRLIIDGNLREGMGTQAKRRVASLCDPAARFDDLRRILAKTVEQATRAPRVDA